MIWCLVILLFLSQVIIYFCNGKKLFSASFIANLVFLFSAFVYLIYKDSFFGSDISWRSVVFTMVFLVSIFLGEIFSNNIHAKRSNDIPSRKKGIVPIEIGNFIIVIAFIFTVFSGYLYFSDVYKYSLTVGNSSSNFFGMAEYVRKDGTYSTPTFISILILVSECLVYFLTYAFVSNLLNKKRHCFKYLLPMLGYLLYIFACHSRGNIVRNISIICAIVFCLVSQKNRWKMGSNKTILRVGLISIFIFAILFRILGYRTGTSFNLSFSLNMTDYISSGLFGFDKYLTEPINHSQLFGEKTLNLIYLKLNDYGFNFDLGPQFESFYSYKGYSSNTYTGFKMLIDDFDFLGCWLLLFIYSFITTKMVLTTKNKGCSLVRCSLLGILFYPIVMISIAGCWSSVFSSTTIYTIVILIVLERLLIDSRKRSYGYSQKLSLR